MAVISNTYVASAVFWGSLFIITWIVSGCAPQLAVHEAGSEVKVTTCTIGQFMNIYYVEVGEKTLLIDCGNVGDSAKEEEFLTEKALDLAQVDYLVITHGHAAHAGSARYFQEKYEMKIIAGANESEIIAAGGYDKNLCPRGFEGWLVNRLVVGPTYRPFHPDIAALDILDIQ